jgi:hypothetical protein
MNEATQLIEDCEARESRLTDWERKFIDNVKQQLESGRGLSPRQSELLDTMWERVTAKG